METTWFLVGIGMQEIIIIVFVVLLFFGGRKIPELMKGIGKGVRSFKEGMSGIDEIKPEKEEQKTERTMLGTGD